VHALFSGTNLRFDPFSVETVKQILYEQGGDYLLTVKKNQKGLFETLSTLFAEQRFPPSAHAAHPRHDPG
jgi:hypothetical protein